MYALTICKCLHEFLLYSSITRQCSRPFVIKLDHFAHGVLMGYYFWNKPILVWRYRFSSDQIVCSLGEPFHPKQPDHFILRMIISLFFEPIRNSSRDHLRFAYAIWHDCIFGGKSTHITAHFAFTTSCKSGKLCRQFPVCLSFLAPQITLRANFKDVIFCGSILLF